jgi:predicted negative regulator of RcsB-dependent stress response
VSDRQPIDRVRTLLLRGDNLLKKGDREHAIAAFVDAREAAADPTVPEAVRELVERRLEGLR